MRPGSARGIGLLFARPAAPVHCFITAGCARRTPRGRASFATGQPRDAPRLDGPGFERANLRRLAPFLKFLLLQAVPFAGAVYAFRRLERRKKDLLSVPLDTDEQIVGHIDRVLRHSVAFLLTPGDCRAVEAKAIFAEPEAGVALPAISALQRGRLVGLKVAVPGSVEHCRLLAISREK